MVVGRTAALAEGVAIVETVVLEEVVTIIASVAVAVSRVAKIDDMSTLASPTGEEVTTG